MKYFTRRTRHVVVRPFELKDFGVWRDANLQQAKSKNVWDLGGKPRTELTLAKFKKMLAGHRERRQADTYYDFGVFNKDGALVGIVSLMEVSRNISQTAFLGYRIFNHHWRKGYGKEAVKAVLDIGFNDIKLHRIEAGVEPGNIRSIRLARSLGMRREGLKRRAIYLRNKWVDLLMYTLTSEDVGKKFNTSTLKFKPRS